MGMVLSIQTLIESKLSLHNQHILEATHTLFLFGTPHGGLRTDELDAMVDAEFHSKGSHSYLLYQLREGSEFLEAQKEKRSRAVVMMMMMIIILHPRP